jgi:hypothetical protein
MFEGCSALIEAPELKATTLATCCYQSMFKNCTSLITVHDLPGLKLCNGCYKSMFEGCSNLQIAPEICAIDSINGAYESCENMFYNCKKLRRPPSKLSPLVLNRGTYAYMFSGCESLTYAPLIEATTVLDSDMGGPLRGMFADCSKLVTAPKLHFTTLKMYMFAGMFYNCTSLIEPPSLPWTELAPYCYSGMFENCTSLITAPELPATELTPHCYRGMFSGCTSLTKAPDLLAYKLEDTCYYYMFYKCNNLNRIRMLATDTSANNCLVWWVYGVANTGTFIKNVNMTSLPTSDSGIPKNWTVQDDFTPIKCLSLSITADDVRGRDTQTTIYYTAEVEGLDSNGNTCIQTISNTAISDEFPQNTSTTNTVTRTISYTYMGVTATTTITQGVWVSSNFTIDLNSNWQISSISNPDSTVYDLYESYSNKGVNNSGAIMYIDIDGYENFEFYIRSFAESKYDYVMVSQLDKELTYSTSYSDTTLVKAYTRGNQQSGTALSNYTKVTFSGIDGGSHRICIIYRKDSSTHSGDDRGYLLINRNQ